MPPRKRLARVGGHVADLARLPRVTIATDAAAPILDRVNYVPGTVAISGPTGTAPLAGQFRGRGNSTWSEPKKPYRIKLGASASLVPGAPADKDWVLLASYKKFDPSLLRTMTAMEIGRRCSGLPWTPRFRPVDLVLNGDKLGVYHLGEHVKIATGRNNITKIAAGDTAGLPLTGGYTLEVDRRYIDNGDPGFTTGGGTRIAFDDPDGSVPAQASYITGWIQTFEDTLFGSSWLDPATGYARFIDMPSFIDWYLVNELAANQDSQFFSSCKLYKTRDTAQTPGRLYMGPLWDFDLSMGHLYDTGAYITDPASWRSTSGWWTRGGFAYWIARMLADPTFIALARTRWASLTGNLAGNTGEKPIGTFIAERAARMSQQRLIDQTRWQYTGTTSAAVSNLQAWLTARIAWITANL